MIEPETPFQKRIKRLKSPTSQDFDVSVLLQALDPANEATIGDLELAMSAVWFAAQSRGLREHFPDPGLRLLDRRLSTMLAVASLNRLFRIITDRAGRKARRAADAGALAFDHVSQLPLSTYPGQQLDADSMIESVTDAIDSWLWDVANQTEANSGHMKPPDLQKLGMQSVQRYTLQSGLHYQWQKVLWEDWRIQGTNSESLTLTPTDRQLATLFDAWAARQQSNSMDLAWIDISAWRRMPPERRHEFQLQQSVTRVEKMAGQKRHFVVGRSASHPKHVPTFVVWRAIFDASYVSLFLDRALPRAPDINCMLLLRAWHVIYDLADRLSRDLPKPSLYDEAAVRQCSLAVKRSELADVLCRALRISPRIALQLIEFLSWKPGGYRGIWGSPLVPIPNTKRLSIARAVLAVSNPIRVAEIWLHKGGLDDNLSQAARGSSYEAYLRESIGEAISKNDLLIDVASARHGVRKSSEFPEQIDLLLRLGSLLIVGEVKCLLSPADPRERFNYLQAIKSATQQATRKAIALDQNRSIIERTFEITSRQARELEILPIVVTNQGFGASLEFGRCLVVDQRFLEIYLSSGSFVAGAAFDPKTGNAALEEREFYRDQSEAERKFKRNMKYPPTLKRFIDRLEWTSTAVPTLSGKPLYIQGTLLRDISGKERPWAQVLRAAAQTA